jgi:hypothetical protein
VGADVGAEVGDEAVDEGHDAEVAVEADLDVVLLLPRMVGGHEVLAAVLDPLHGPAELHGRPRDHEVLRIELPADAEAAPRLQLHEVDEVFGVPSSTASSATYRPSAKTTATGSPT